MFIPGDMRLHSALPDRVLSFALLQIRKASIFIGTLNLIPGNGSASRNLVVNLKPQRILKLYPVFWFLKYSIFRSGSTRYVAYVWLIGNKKAPIFIGAFNLIPGNDLLSHKVAQVVPSALKGLTAEFGMGSGVSPSLWSPEKFNHFGVCHNLKSCRIEPLSNPSSATGKE